MRKMSPQPEFDPQIVQSVASRHADYPILAHTHGVTQNRGYGVECEDVKLHTNTRHVRGTFSLRASSSCRQRVSLRGYQPTLRFQTSLQDGRAWLYRALALSHLTPTKLFSILHLWKIFTPLNYTYMQHKHKVLKCLYALL